MLDISPDLLHKYNVPGPRYTSYPPAPSWTQDFGPADYEGLIATSAAPLSLYFHLPFCEELCYFCGCTTVITGKNHSKENSYIDALLKEVGWLADRIDKKRKVLQLHLGGGTPTYNTPENLEKLLRPVKEKFRFDAAAEIGVEVDPRVTNERHLKALAGLGFNRLSMGVQDFDPRVQEAVNRVQSVESTKVLLDTARSLGFTSVNIDLIYGLPHQTPASFRTTIEKVLEINPDRLAVYSYAHVPWLKHYQDTLAPYLPNEREKYEIFLCALKLFSENGYEYIGMDHFAKADDELAQARANRTLWRNFQGYTTKAGTDLFGLGMSAIGKVADGFVQNEKDLKKYQECMTNGKPATVRGFRLSADDRMRGRIIQNLLCHATLVKTEIEREFDIPFDSYFDSALTALKGMEKDGLVQLSRDEIRPTALGRIFLRNIAMPFDAYLPAKTEERKFSKTL